MKNSKFDEWADKMNKEEGRWYNIALLLRDCRNEKLFLERNFATFEEFVDKWMERSPPWASQQITSAEAIEQMMNFTMVNLPKRERHARPLSKVEDTADRITIWKKLTEDPETQITAADVEAAVEKYEALKNKNWITLDEWNNLTPEGKVKAFTFKTKNKATMNKQESASIEWAQWSWNPITGCRHDCPYCYARDIAARFFAQGFEPSILPRRFKMPAQTAVPEVAMHDIAYKNVFTCSMADLFGRWVPAEWIEAVLEVVIDNPQWNFLFLTKFPKRMAEFKFPKNAWLGTTVDLQSRVKNAEDAFERITGGTKWLSIEPMLEKLQFSRLSLFDWVVVGGASRSSETPEWIPPMDWLVNIHNQARAANCKIYYKDNTKLPEELRIREFPWTARSERTLPHVFNYLGKN